MKKIIESMSSYYVMKLTAIINEPLFPFLSPCDVWTLSFLLLAGSYIFRRYYQGHRGGWVLLLSAVRSYSGTNQGLIS